MSDTLSSTHKNKWKYFKQNNHENLFVIKQNESEVHELSERKYLAHNSLRDGSNIFLEEGFKNSLLEISDNDTFYRNKIIYLE